MKSKRRRGKATGYLKKIDGRYYLRTRIYGHDRCTLLREADGTPVSSRERATELAQLAAVAPQIPVQIPAVSAIWETYVAAEERPDSGASTLNKYRVAVSLFQEWYKKDVPISEITQLDAKNFFAYLWDERHISGSSYNSYRQALMLVFKVLCAKCALPNPFALIQSKPRHGVRHNAFTEDQVNAIFDGFKHGFFYNTEIEVMGAGRKHIRKECRKEYKPLHADEMEIMLLLCCWTGCRGQDACLMRWSNVDLSKNEISYIPRKTARATGDLTVTLPLHPALHEGLIKAKAFKSRNKNGEDYIIPNIRERYEKNPSGLQKTVQRIISCATGESTTATEIQGHRARRANIYGTHSFRHTFISFCANAGVPLEVVAAIVGHSSTDMTRHYTHISDAAKQSAIDKLVHTDTKKTSNLLSKLEELPEEKLNALIALIEKGARLWSLR